jgi:transposase
VRLIPAQYVKPYVNRNKSDYIDGEAIAEAVSRPTMRFVPIKTDRHRRRLNPHSHARDGRFDGRLYMANSGIRN